MKITFEAVKDLFLEIESKHPNMYWKVNKERFWREVNSIFPYFNDLNEYEQNREVLRLNALIRDFHTRPLVFVPNEGRLPFAVERFEHKYFITDILGEVLEGGPVWCYEITRINGIRISEIEKRFLRIISAEVVEGKYGLIKNYLMYPDMLKIIGVMGPRDNEVRIELRSPYSGEQNIVTARPGEFKVDTLEPIEFGERSRYMWLTVNTFTGVAPAETDEKVAKTDQELAEMVEAGKSWIIDLRNNPGGTTYNLVFPKFMEALKNSNATGYCIINNNSMSSSILMATHLKALGFILVGEDGGQPSSFYAMAGEPITTKYGLKCKISRQWCEVSEAEDLHLSLDEPLKVDIDMVNDIYDISEEDDSLYAFVVAKI